MGNSLKQQALINQAHPAPAQALARGEVADGSELADLAADAGQGLEHLRAQLASFRADEAAAQASPCCSCTTRLLLLLAGCMLGGTGLQSTCALSWPCVKCWADGAAALNPEP